jgi:hypothetical protein
MAFSVWTAIQAADAVSYQYDVRSQAPRAEFAQTPRRGRLMPQILDDVLLAIDPPRGAEFNELVGEQLGHIGGAISHRGR